MPDACRVVNRSEVGRARRPSKFSKRVEVDLPLLGERAGVRADVPPDRSPLWPGYSTENSGEPAMNFHRAARFADFVFSHGFVIAQRYREAKVQKIILTLRHCAFASWR